MKHITQNCESSCGPTSLKMIMMIQEYRNDLNIQDIFNLGGTKISGTPWHRMSRIIKTLNIKHDIKINTKIRKLRDKNKVWMVSTHSGGIRHWVVLKEYNNGNYIVYDPISSVLKYDEDEINDLMSNRNYLSIEFNLNDFYGTSDDFRTFDDDGNYIMNFVDEYEMLLLKDSNYIFSKKGLLVNDIRKQKKVNNIDYIYSIHNISDIKDDFVYDYIFAQSIDKVILMKYCL